MGPGSTGSQIPFSFNCHYPGGNYSAELSCTRCIVKKKLCGSQAIQAAHHGYVEKAKGRSKKRRNAQQAEKRKIRKKREAEKALNRQMRQNRRAEILRATVFDRRMAALHRELILLHGVHVELASLTELEQQRWERECRQKRQQEQQEQLELLATMNELVWIYKDGFAACGDR
jgi:hypothetical protein